MIQVIPATFEDGVFKPDAPLSLSPHTRVRLLVEIPDDDAEKQRQQAWDALGGFVPSSNAMRLRPLESLN